MWKSRWMAAAVVCLVCAWACTEKGSKAGTDPSPTAPSTPAAPAPSGTAAALQTLAAKAIYFGHQSVGFNIMDGVQALIAGTPGATLRIQQTSTASSMAKGVFAHASNGANGDPSGKVAAFVATIERGAGGKVDIAFFKFCYVDFSQSTDVARVFSGYRSSMASLRAAYPAVRFVHLTVPLTTGSSPDNAVRERFSDLVRQTYQGLEPVFDLAKAESTRPDGSVETYGGVRALVAAYSSDGGHLNAAGQDVVAKAFVTFLASIQ